MSHREPRSHPTGGVFGWRLLMSVETWRGTRRDCATTCAPLSQPNSESQGFTPSPRCLGDECDSNDPCDLQTCARRLWDRLDFYHCDAVGEEVTDLGLLARERVDSKDSSRDRVQAAIWCACNVVEVAR